MPRRKSTPRPPKSPHIRCQRCGVALALNQIQLKQEGKLGPLIPVCEKDGVYLQALYPEATFLALPPAPSPALANPDPREDADTS